MIWLLALAIGIIAGLRVFTALAAIAWAASLGRLDLTGSWLTFLGWRFTPWIVTLLALAELVTDQLPSTPSRKVPAQFGARLIAGALCGAAIGLPTGIAPGGAVAGIVGALIGTYGGAWARGRLATAFGSDRPAALIEDAVAIGGALAILAAL